MHQLLSLDADRVRFPSRCVRCGAPPTSGAVLRGSGGIQAPLCAACGARSDLVRASSVLALVGVAIAMVIGAALLLEIVLPFPDDADGRAALGMVYALVLLALAGAGLVLAIRGALRMHGRRFLPVHFVRREGGAVVLAFRDEALTRDVAMQSGLAVDESYRQPGSAPEPFRPDGSPVDGVAVATIASLFACTAFVHALDLTRWTGERTMHWLEAIVFDVGGIPALVGMWGLFGATTGLFALATLALVVRDALGAGRR
jgi:hypothetical protein